MIEITPPESVHALDLEELRSPDITFWSAWESAEFAPARVFYLRHGFEHCGSFAKYTDDPNSVFMTKTLQDPFLEIRHNSEAGKYMKSMSEISVAPRCS
jgi:hypothetical protein